MTQAPATRRYQTAARSTDTFGRVLVSARDQHLIVDGPVTNGCPGEAIGPAELFLSGVASCGVELIHVLARQQDVPLRSVHCTISATQDPAAPVRSDVNLFNTVSISFELGGVSREQGTDLVERFRRR
ncbi:MAG: OsmC family protein [Chloroflexi bacterium]|nr:OsmC family protein [Chloroflexota bacterium]